MRGGDTTQPTLGHSAECRVRVEERVAADPEFSHNLTGARARQDEFFARRVELGDESAKKSRMGEQDTNVEFGSGPATASEDRREDVAVPSEGGAGWRFSG